MLRYLAARNFMLSGTALLRGCEELGTSSLHFITSIDILKQIINLIVPVPLIFTVAKMNGNLCQFLCIFSNSFRNKNKGDRDNQINFLLQNINAGDEMKA